MSTKEAGGFRFGNAVSSSQDGLNNHDAQDLLNPVDGGADKDGINLNMDPDEATTAVNTMYKRNRLNTTVCNIEDSLTEIEDMLTDQVVLNMLLEVLAETNDLIVPYFRNVSPILDIPTEDLKEENKNLDKFIPGICDKVFSQKPGSLNLRNYSHLGLKTRMMPKMS